jgi:hypothetical protein
MHTGTNHIDCENARPLIDRRLNNNLSPEEEGLLQAHLAACPSCSAELRMAGDIQALVRRAVNNVETPVMLRERVAGVTSQRDPTGRIIPFEGGAASHRSERSWWRYAAAAAIAIALLGSWFLFFDTRTEAPTIAGDPVDTAQRVTAVEAQLAEVLRIGVADHIRCGVTFHSSTEEQFTPEQIVREMGEYEGLVPIVREHLGDYRVAVAHQCTIGGRKYVHLILRRGEEMVSIAITRRKPGEAFPHDAQPAGTSSTPIYQARLDDYHSAGFQTDEYFAFVVSDRPHEENMQMASVLAGPMVEFLGKMRV